MKNFLLFLFTLSLFQQTQAQTVVGLVGSSPFQDSLWVLDTTAGFTVARRLGPTPSSGGSITGMTGLAKNPNSGTIYVICKQSATTGRTLGTLNLATGVITIVGNLGDNFSSLTFRGDSLFGATGNGATTPETLFLIDTLTATPTLQTAMGAGADGEVICYNPFNDMIYHWSGNSTVVYEKILPYPPYTITDIPTSGTSGGETFGAVNISASKFIRSTISSNFTYHDTSGVYTGPFASLPDDFRGLVLISCDRTISGPSTYCVGDSITLTVPAANAYQWYKDGTPISGATNQTLVVNSAGSYTCFISDNCGNNFNTPFAVTENPLPVVVLSTADTSICAGDSTLLTGTSGVSHQWYMNGTMISGATSDSYIATSTGMYNMMMTDANGCSDSSATDLEIVVNPLPAVGLSAALDSVCADDMLVALTVTPMGGTLTGTAVTGSNFDPTMAATGNNTIVYTFTDVNGCVNSDTTVIYVDACMSLTNTVNDFNFSVYPNPVNNQLSITSSLEIIGLTLTDLAGKTVLTIAGNTKMVNMSNLEKGIYTLTIKTTNQQTSVVKIIKQ